MAYGTNTGQDFTYPVDVAGAMTQFTFVKLNSSGNLIKCTGNAGVPEEAVGVCQDDAAASTSSQVRLFGPTKILCGGSFNPGDFLTSDSSARAVKYTTPTIVAGTPAVVTGTSCYGIAEAAGALNNISSMLFSPRGLIV